MKKLLIVVAAALAMTGCVSGAQVKSDCNPNLRNLPDCGASAEDTSKPAGPQVKDGKAVNPPTAIPK